MQCNEMVQTIWTLQPQGAGQQLFQLQTLLRQIISKSNKRAVEHTMDT